MLTASFRQVSTKQQLGEALDRCFSIKALLSNNPILLKETHKGQTFHSLLVVSVNPTVFKFKLFYFNPLGLSMSQEYVTELRKRKGQLYRSYPVRGQPDEVAQLDRLYAFFTFDYSFGGEWFARGEKIRVYTVKEALTYEETLSGIGAWDSMKKSKGNLDIVLKAFFDKRKGELISM